MKRAGTTQMKNIVARDIFHDDTKQAAAVPGRVIKLTSEFRCNCGTKIWNYGDGITVTVY